MPPYPALPASPPPSPRLAPSTINDATIKMASLVCDQFWLIDKGHEKWSEDEVRSFMVDWANDWIDSEMKGDLNNDWPAEVGYMMIPRIAATINWEYITKSVNDANDCECGEPAEHRTLIGGSHLGKVYAPECDDCKKESDKRESEEEDQNIPCVECGVPADVACDENACPFRIRNREQAAH